MYIGSVHLQRIAGSDHGHMTQNVLVAHQQQAFGLAARRVVLIGQISQDESRWSCRPIKAARRDGNVPGHSFVLMFTGCGLKTSLFA
jgi:hypothetical protein